LAQAKALGDYLVVAVNSDDSVRRIKGTGRPINSCEDRMSVLSSLRSVDAVLSFSEDSVERLISCLLPDILVKGGDYTPETVVGASYVLARGGKVEVLNFVPGCSTTTIITRAQATKTEEVKKAG
jgi:D-beta-D-heptose 7-phosphate kinase / D-beta-D-heptose 1-phosphate adenosyltransferase